MEERYCFECTHCYLNNNNGEQEYWCSLYGEDVTGNIACQDFEEIEENK